MLRSCRGFVQTVVLAAVDSEFIHAGLVDLSFLVLFVELRLA